MALRLPFRKRRILLVVIVLGLVYLILILIGTQRSQEREIVCNYGPEVQEKLKDLLIRVKTCLDSLSISYFLCYNSLWGALKMQNVLPWMDNLEICIVNDDLAKLEEAFVIRVFRREGLQMNYQMSNGIYDVSDTRQSSSLIKLFLFEKDSITGQYRRVGWRNRIMPPSSCEAIHCFPPRLIEKPLPTATLLNIEMNVPREEVELQKYLFPDNWWRELEPEACRNKKSTSR